MTEFESGVAVLGLIAIHTTSAWAWPGVYYTLGEFTDFSRALYFSVVTSTTLGYGDITLTGRWQLLASFEAMGGLILFGASTAFLLAVTRSWFSHLSESERQIRPTAIIASLIPCSAASAYSRMVSSSLCGTHSRSDV